MGNLKTREYHIVVIVTDVNFVQMPWSGTKEYKCYEDADSNEYRTFIGYLGVDHPPKTSPKWCSKRVKE